MKAFSTLLLFLVATVLGCGQQLVEFPTDGTPMVLVTDPSTGAVGVATDTQVTATFNEAMDPTTITTSTFSLAQAGTPIAATVTYTGTTATLVPASALPTAVLLTATITTGAEDTHGHALAANYVWTFTTRAAPDNTPPTVVLTNPFPGAVAVATNTHVSAAFDEAMDPTTLTASTFTLTQAGAPIAATVTYAGTMATLVPSSALPTAALLTATITTGATDTLGNALAANYVWTFTTGDTPDTTAPTVSFTDPGNHAVSVDIAAKVHVAFSEAMDPSTLTTTTLTITQAGRPSPAP